MSYSDATLLPSWADQMRALERVGANLTDRWRPGGATEAERQDMNRLALSMLSCGYLCRVYTDARRPAFMPLWNYAFNQGGPNPDYVYATTEVDPTGVYRISGYRGTTRFVEIAQQSFDILSPSVLAGGSPVVASHDLDELEIDEGGYFSVVLSAQRPASHRGDWWELDSGTLRLLLRSCSADWKHDI